MGTDISSATLSQVIFFNYVYAVSHIRKMLVVFCTIKPTAVVVLDTPVPVRSLKLSNIEPG